MEPYQGDRKDPCWSVRSLINVMSLNNYEKCRDEGEELLWWKLKQQIQIYHKLRCGNYWGWCGRCSPVSVKKQQLIQSLLHMDRQWTAQLAAGHGVNHVNNVAHPIRQPWNAQRNITLGLTTSPSKTRTWSYEPQLERHSNGWHHPVSPFPNNLTKNQTTWMLYWLWYKIKCS